MTYVLHKLKPGILMSLADVTLLIYYNSFLICVFGLTLPDFSSCMNLLTFKNSWQSNRAYYQGKKNVNMQNNTQCLCLVISCRAHWHCTGDEWIQKYNCEGKYEAWRLVCSAGRWLRDWLAATSCAKLLLSFTDLTKRSVFIYAWSVRPRWVPCKAGYFPSCGRRSFFH